ncbi:MAG: DUF1501 domain-containing protein [Planctomycetes bacterium]|nr:DUF1501 domain-containing protein [Planctomycetota bacterium]
MLNWESGFSRRGFLQGGVGLAALMLAKGSRLAADGSFAGTVSDAPAKSVIVLLLEGGMSHLETWDPKPNAPREIRGTYDTIATANPQLRIGEHMPLLAKQAQRYNIIRSVHSSARNHSPGLHWILTGFDNPAAGVNGQKVNKVPSVGSIVARQRGGTTANGLPNFVAVPNRSQLGGRVNFLGAADLGSAYEAFNSGPVPARSRAKYAIPSGLTLPQDISVTRLQDRRALLKSIDRLQRERERAESLHGMSDYQRQAFDLLLGDEGRKAFDINQESAKTRRLYGDSVMGQGTLLARRLTEAGVSFVLVNYSKNNSWDSHRNVFTRLKKRLLPPMDRAVSALLTDLDQRGRLDDTLVLMMSEMGRTPKINKNSGRDHWPDVYSVLLAGGGLTRGQLLGSSTRDGGKPGTRPVHVQEVLATVYQQLGIDPELKIPDRQNRPTAILPDAHPVRELIAR